MTIAEETPDANARGWAHPAKTAELGPGLTPPEPVVTHGLRLSSLVQRLREGSTCRIKHLDQGKWQELSARELFADVRLLATKLRNAGVQRGARVGILGTNSLFWIVADLALLELEAISVAIPEHLSAEHAELAERYDLSLLLVESHLLRAGSWPSWVLPLDGTWEASPTLRSGARLEPELASGQPTLAFSSGTSGKLKCLRISRRGLEHLVDSFVRAYGVGKHDTLLVFLPLSNLQQRMMVFGALWFGMKLVLVKPQQLFRALQDEKPTIVIGPPLLYETAYAGFLKLPRYQRGLARAVAKLARLLPAPARDALLRRVFARLHASFGGESRVLITGMAPIRPATLRFLRSAGLPLYEVYGLNECGLVSGNRPSQDRIGSVGKPFDPGSVELASDGEILVRRRDMLAFGYENEPDERQTFETDDLVRTGDIGHLDADGFLFIDGRKKELLMTSGGYKLHPELLETRFNGCEVVANSAVILSSDAKRLLVVVVPREGKESKAEQVVRDYIRELNRSLPISSQIAAAVMAREPFSVEAGTLTRNLKLNRSEIAKRYADLA